MFKYAAVFIGLLILATIPEYASLLQFAVQGLIGMFIFLIGSINLISEQSN